VDKTWTEIGVGCLGVLALIAILTIAVAFLITIVWSWVVPDVFAGAVELGILPSSITLMQAFKLSILLSILGLTNRAGSSKK